MSFNTRLAISLAAIALYFGFLFQAVVLTRPNIAQKAACERICSPRGLTARTEGDEIFFWQHRARCTCKEEYHLDRDGGAR
jgi:hypothetical protein